MNIKPFKGYRPLPELAEKVALIPNNLMNEPDRRRAAKNNPYSFAHVVKPRINFGEGISKTDQQVFDFARNYFEKLVHDGILIRDGRPCLYLYRLTLDGRSQTGLICCLNIDDYLNGKIKKHEHTREEKEQENVIQIENTRLNSNPVFLAYRPVDAIEALTNQLTAVSPLCDFNSGNGVKQQLWVVNDEPVIRQLVTLFDKEVAATYIADGHHRAAAACRFSQKMEGQGALANHDYKYFLACLFPANELKIYDYNRVVKSLNGNDQSSFMKKVTDRFIVEAASRSPYQPQKAHRFGMYLGGKWYKLKAREGSFADDPVNSLDVSILQNQLLEPVLGISDPRTDKNIDFIAGTKGLKELEKRVKKGKAAVAFSLRPVTMEELMTVSDAGKVMPPKSTWFEPKLLSGLVTYKMEF